MKIKKLTAAGIATLALSTGTIGMACSSFSVAHADGTVATATVSDTATYTLNIHKYAGGPVTGTTNDGTEQTVTGRDALTGVVFDVYHVDGVDLTTNAGWQAATDLQGHVLTQTEIAAGSVTGTSGKTYTITKTASPATDNTGLATFGQDGDAGLYVVNENLAASGNITKADGTAVAKSSVSPSAPFLVTLPMTNPTDTSSWLNTVNVYPKNSIDSITKTVNDEGTNTAEQAEQGDGANAALTYGLTSTIAPNVTAADRGTYVVADKFPAQVGFNGTVNVNDSTNNNYTVGTDYNVYVNGVLNNNYTDATGGETVQIVMTQDGLTKMAGVTDQATLTVDLGGKILSEGASHTVDNTAELIPSNSFWTSVSGKDTPYNPTTDTPYGPNTPGIPSNQVSSHYGDINITKVDGANTATTLAGATFDVYQIATPSTDATQNQNDCNKLINVTPQIGLVQANTFASPAIKGVVTGADGKVSVKGLQESDFYNNAQATGGQDSPYMLYCLVETKAPTGYNLLAKPVPVLLMDTTAGAAVTVADEASNLNNNLPHTGGTGAASWVTAGSVAGVAVLGGAYMVMRKRRQDAELDA